MATVEQEERAVEEVLCYECGAPMPAIPSWYATVKLKFTCDNCRQKSSKPAPIPTLDVVLPRSAALADDADIEVVADEVDLEVADDEDIAEVETADAEVEVVDAEE